MRPSRPRDGRPGLLTGSADLAHRELVAIGFFADAVVEAAELEVAARCAIAVERTLTDDEHAAYLAAVAIVDADRLAPPAGGRAMTAAELRGPRRPRRAPHARRPAHKVAPVDRRGIWMHRAFVPRHATRPIRPEGDRRVFCDAWGRLAPRAPSFPR